MVGNQNKSPSGVITSKFSSNFIIASFDISLTQQRLYNNTTGQKQRFVVVLSVCLQ